MNQRLLSIIRAARARWRLRLLLRGAAILVVAALATVLFASWGMDRLRFAPWAVRILPLATWGTLAWVAWRALGRQVWRRASDAQVALYLEEHERALEGRLLAAVRFAGTGDPRVSRALVDRLVEDAVRRCETESAWRGIERRGLAGAGAALAATLLAAAALVIARPGFLAHGAPYLLPLAGAGERPYTIGVEPGDTLIARGADLGVSARLNGFAADAAELVLRRVGEESWERSVMIPDPSSGQHEALVLGLRADLEYLVEAAGVRSRVFTVRVADLPWTEGIGVEFRFPRYTGLGSRTQVGGDVAAIAGTEVRVFVKPTLPVSTGRLVLNARDTVAMSPDTGGTLRGAFTLRESGEYRVLFPGPDGRLGPGSPVYAIEVLPDQPPHLSFTKPGRDADATPIDEVFLEARAQDDVGVRMLELRYRVNGGAERTVRLFDGAARREVVAGHTLFLEELALQPGDVIVYFARAADGRPGAEPALSDIYFLTIRPFDRAFREAEQNGMGMGEGAVDAGELSERQRQIVAGTFRVVRDRAGDTQFRDDLAALMLAQGRLRDEVEILVRRLRTRGVADADSAMTRVADALDSAVAAMGEAEERLGRRRPEDALTPEQRALTHLQRAEAVFNRERQVARGGQQRDGGNAATAEELADLFELELDRMRNQYETLERDQRRGADAERDEVLERVRELARRQQQEAARRRAQPQGGGSAAGQRRLAEESEELARRLERLSREREEPELREAAERLRDAAQQMRRGAADRGTAGEAALDRLRQAQRELERNRTSGLSRDVERTREQARRLVAQQRHNVEDVERLPGDDPAARAQRIQRLLERKGLMAQDVAALEADLERLSREAQAGQPQAAERLREAARGLREGRVEDKIRYSRGLVQARSSDVARTFEEQIEADLDSLGGRLDAALGAIGESREDRVARALERTRDVASALESLGERARGVRPGQEDADQRRQIGRELAERGRELRDIRDALRREGVDVDDLEPLIGALARADNAGPVGTPWALESLSQVIAPGLREFEFGVRRAIAGDAAGPRVGGESAAPPGYRRMVAEYFRALAERGARPAPPR